MSNITNLSLCTKYDPMNYAFENWEQFMVMASESLAMVAILLLVGLAVAVIVMGIVVPIKRCVYNRERIRSQVIREMAEGNYIPAPAPKPSPSDEPVVL
jgi:hypothetical protein